VWGWVEFDVAGPRSKSVAKLLGALSRENLLASEGISPSAAMGPTDMTRNVPGMSVGCVTRCRVHRAWPLAVLLGACVPEPAGAPAPYRCPVPRCPSQPTSAYGAPPPVQPSTQSDGQLAPAAAGPAAAGDPVLAQSYQGASALRILEGKAAYYSDALAGRPTASGEPYDPAAFTAAHRTLPFGTVLRVVSGERGVVVYVRVNDRGPFGDDERIVDLSRAAAEALGMIQAGVIAVRVEILAYGSVGPSR